MKRTSILLACLALIFGILAFVYGRAVIQNDGISYYALTASLVDDHDFRLENQYKDHHEIRVIPLPDGKVASYYSCGYAFLYAPFVFLMDRATDLNTYRPYAQNSVFPFSHAAGIFAGSVFYAFFSVCFAFFYLIRRRNMNPVPAILISLAVFLGTPLIFYAFTVPSFAHASDTVVVACGFYLATLRKNWNVGSIRMRNVLLGFVLALSVMLRNNNVVIVPVFVAWAVFMDREKYLQTCAEIFAGALPILTVHALFNLDQYGKLLATGYDVRITAQQAQYRIWRFFFIFFHPVVGLYPWSPITLLATVGLILAAKRRDSDSTLALAVVIVVIISIRFAAIIFPGSTFGQRLLTHLYIFWIPGIAEIFTRWKRVAVASTIACVLWSFLLFNSYYILTGCRMGRVMTKKGGSSPIEWLAASYECYTTTKQDHANTNAFAFWYNNLAARPYPTLMTLRD